MRTCMAGERFYLEREELPEGRTHTVIEVPRELGLTQAQCILQKRSWYGTRAAGQAFEFAVAEGFEKRDFIKGTYSACVFKHRICSCSARCQRSSQPSVA